MTPPPLVLCRHDAAGALTLRVPVEAVYTTSHLDVAADNPWYSTGQFWERLVDIYAPLPGFELVTGWVGAELAGFAFGSPTVKTDDLWEAIGTELPDLARPGDPAPIYIFREIATAPAHQGRGYGRALHDALLAPRTEAAAHLVVRQTNPAREHYRNWGWRHLGTKQPFPDSPVMYSMILPLGSLVPPDASAERLT